MRRLLLTALVLAGCSETFSFPLSDVEFDYGFVVTFGEAGGPKRVSRAFGVADGRVVFGEVPALELEEEERRFIFVALKKGVIHPAFVPARAAEIEGLLEAPPPGLVVEPSAANGRLTGKLRLPDDATLLTSALDGDDLRPVEPGEFDLTDRITIRIPVNPEYCQNVGQTELAPYAADARPIPASDTINTVHLLDEGRLLVADSTRIFIVPRGGVTDTSTRPGPLWSVFDDPAGMPKDSLRSVAVGPKRPDGSLPVVAVGGEYVVEPTYARAWPLRIEGDRIVQEGPSVQTAGDAFRSVGFTPDGRVWIGGNEGIIATLDEDGALATAVILPHRDDLHDYTAAIHATGDSEYPLMISTRSRVHVLDREGTWTSQFIQRGGILGPDPLVFFGLGLVRDQEGAELWAVGSRSQIARRRDDGSFILLEDEEMTLSYPPRFEACASSRNPGEPLDFNRHIFAAAIGSAYVHLAYENCSALVAVRRSDLCVSMVPRRGAPPTFEEASIRSMDRRGHLLVVGTTDGQVLESILP